jgi:diguanylate cyclase (GGDEF)-like protein/PAS domain S-box-containing protein
VTARTPSFDSPLAPEDALIQVVLRLTAWVFVVAGLTLAISLGLSQAAPALQIGLNLGVAVIGMANLLLLRKGHHKSASHCAVWGMWVIITILVATNGGLDAPNLLNYPALMVLCGWLLGDRATKSLYGITALALMHFYTSNPVTSSAPVVPGGGLIKLFFILIVLFITGALTILVRRSYLQQLAKALNSTRALQAQEAELRKLSLAVEQNPESVMITNLLPSIEYVNDAFVAKSGYTREEAIGQNPRFRQSGQLSPAVYAQMWSQLSQGDAWRGEFINRHKDGSIIVESAVVAPIRQADGTISHFVAISKDMTAMRQAQHDIQRLTHFDSLTGLPNRTLLMDRIELVLASARRSATWRALIVINVERFRDINDARGHAAGDVLLKLLGPRITQLLRSGDTLARIASAEFAILLEDLGESADNAAPRAMAVANKIHGDLRHPFDVGGESGLTITVSQGIALFPTGDGDDSAPEIFRRSQTAMHRCMTNGGARIAYFDSSMDAALQERFLIDGDLRRGIRAGQLRLYLQPQVDASGYWVAAEVLVRWQHPQRGLVAPGIFIAIAEASDLIVDLGVWVMFESCRLIAQEALAGRALKLSVNISARHFRQATFVLWLQEVLRETGAAPDCLTVEFTESLVIEDIDDVIGKMRVLADMGVQFSIDDFGTGYSSLAYLKRLPIHEIKIDKTFVQDAPRDASDAALIESILAVANHMHLKVVAEGVETQEQADFLNQRGTVLHQGYFFGRPDAAETWLQRWRAAAPESTLQLGPTH